MCFRFVQAVEDYGRDTIKWVRECFPPDQWHEWIHEGEPCSAYEMVRYWVYYGLMPPAGERSVWENKYDGLPMQFRKKRKPRRLPTMHDSDEAVASLGKKIKRDVLESKRVELGDEVKTDVKVDEQLAQ